MHTFNFVSIRKPILCLFCEDYIVTPRLTAVHCINCNIVFHKACGSALQNSTIKRFCKKNLEPLLSCPSTLECNISTDDISVGEQPIKFWSSSVNVFWLRAFKLERFARWFEAKNITGDMLENLEILSSISNVFYRKAIQTGILAITGKIGLPGENFTDLLEGEEQAEDAQQHDFAIRQGYQCRKCGIICHRTCCAVTDHLRFSKYSACVSSIKGSQYLNESNSSSLSHYEKLPCQLSPFESIYFDVDLHHQPLVEGGVPLFLAKCFESFKAHAGVYRTSNSGPIDLISVYRTVIPPSELIQLRSCYAKQVNNIIAESITKIGQLIKRFLRELPQPIIPYSMYDQAMGLVEEDENDFDKESDEVAIELLESLPQLNRVTLDLLFDHFFFIMDNQHRLRHHRVNQIIHAQDCITREETSHQWTESARLADKANLLLMFQHVLLRPPDSKLLQQRSSTSHVNVIARLWLAPSSAKAKLRDIHSSLQIPDVDEIMAQRSDYSKHAIIPSKFSTEELSAMSEEAIVKANCKDLSTQEWYWGDVDHELAKKVIMEHDDGAFIVRDPSKKKLNTFTLCFKVQSQMRHRYITFVRGLFELKDIDNSKVFARAPLVSDIITHLVQQSTSSFAQPTDQPLRYNIHTPLPRKLSFPLQDSSELANLHEMTENEVLTKLLEVQRDENDAMLNYDELTRKTENISHENQECLLMIKGLTKVSLWFQEQKELQTTNYDQRSSIHKTQRALMMKRQEQLQIDLDHYNFKESQYLDQSCEIQGQQLSTHHEKQRLQAIRKEISLHLNSRGLTDMEITERLALDGKDCIKLKQSTWFSEDPSFVFPNLMQKQYGTFGIRPSSEKNRFTLYIKVHTQLVAKYSICFGHDGFRLGNQEQMFQTLQDLVNYYNIETYKDIRNNYSFRLCYPYFRPGN